MLQNDPYNTTETTETLNCFVLHFCHCGHNFSSSALPNLFCENFHWIHCYFVSTALVPIHVLHYASLMKSTTNPKLKTSNGSHMIPPITSVTSLICCSVAWNNVLHHRFVKAQISRRPWLRLLLFSCSWASFPTSSKWTLSGCLRKSNSMIFYSLKYTWLVYDD